MRDLPVTIAHEPIPMFRLRIINKFRCVTYTKSTDSDVSPTYDQSIPMFPCVVCYSWYTDSDYPFDIFQLFFHLRIFNRFRCLAFVQPTDSDVSPTCIHLIPMFHLHTITRFRCFTYVQSIDSDVSPTHNQPIPMLRLRTINRFRFLAHHLMLLCIDDVSVTKTITI